MRACGRVTRGEEDWVRDTPVIPSWIKSFRDNRRPPLVLNAFDEDQFPTAWRLHDDVHPALFPSESIYGRWFDSRVLFMARDPGTKWPFLPTRVGGGNFPWVANESRPTNRNLRRYGDAMACPKLYASALGCLTLNTNTPKKERIPLRPFLNDHVRAFVSALLQWTMARLPTNDLVVCLGEDSWDLTMQAIGDPAMVGLFHRYRGQTPKTMPNARLKSTRFGAVYHTAYVQKNRDAEWKPIMAAV